MKDQLHAIIMASGNEPAMAYFEVLALKAWAFDLIHLHEQGTVDELRQFLSRNIPGMSNLSSLVTINPDLSMEQLQDFVWDKLQETNAQIVKLTSPDQGLDLEALGHLPVEEPVTPVMPETPPVNSQVDAVPSNPVLEGPLEPAQPAAEDYPLADVDMTTPTERTL